MQVFSLLYVHTLWVLTKNAWDGGWERNEATLHLLYTSLDYTYSLHSSWERQHMTTMTQLLSVPVLLCLGFSLYLLSLLWMPRKHAAFWGVSQNVIEQHRIRFTLRTLAMSIMFLIVGTVMLIPSLTPGVLSSAQSLWLMRGALVPMMVAVIIQLGTYQWKV